MIDLEKEKKSKTGGKAHVYLLARDDFHLRNGLLQPYIQLGGKLVNEGPEKVYEGYPAFASEEDAIQFAYAIGDRNWKVLRLEVAL